tara:strand:+ start:997 stop:1722 length:726 start_codon:yes stop_codon:yes gene_type:complete
MIVVIPAAGQGIRLRPLTHTIPKGLIVIEGKTLLERSLDNLSNYGINKAIIILGHLGEMIKDKLGNNYNGIEITYVENEKYAGTGSMYSLSKAKSLIDDDIIVVESDLLYADKAIKILLNSKFKDVLLVSDFLIRGDDVYVCADGKSRITNVGKHIPEEDKKKAVGALVGISKYSKEFLSKLFEKADQDYSNGELNYHYEETVFATNKLDNPVYIDLCKGLNWIEIDNENDLKRARQIFPW